MRKIAHLGGSILIAVGLGVAAMAAGDPLSCVYGNTVFMTNGKVETTNLSVDANGTSSAP